MSGAIDSLLAKYQPKTPLEIENALKEIIQEITLAGLARGKFFDKAAFYGGTALRIFYGLPRFSEDLDFTLLAKQSDFSLKTYFSAVANTLESFGLEVDIEEVDKIKSTNVESAFLKANTKMHFLRIEAGQKFAEKIQNNKELSIKFEVDITPPLGFETEVKVLFPPITASIRVLKPSYLFSGKMHIILFRKWKQRIKGRDFYDLLWYLGQNIPVKLAYLEAKMREGKRWPANKKMTREDLLHLLEARIKSIDFQNAAQDGGSSSSSSRNVVRAFAKKGVSIGLGFFKAETDLSVTVKWKSTGNLQTIKGSSDRSPEYTALNAQYERVPMQGFGWQAGLSIAKESNRDKDTSDYTLFRGEGNGTFSLDVGNQNAVYFLSGPNIQYLDQSQKVIGAGVGLQLGAGVTIKQKFNLELAHYITRHSIQKDVVESDDIEVTDNSYLEVKSTMFKAGFVF